MQNILTSKNEIIKALLKLIISFTLRKLLIKSGLKNLSVKYLEGMIRDIGLFDDEFYLKHSPDVAESKYSPLEHYLLFGETENRQPCEDFDPSYYKSQKMSGFFSTNSLLHFHLFGFHIGLAPSANFDTKYYLKVNKDVRRRALNPLVHYLKFGRSEGRDPFYVDPFASSSFSDAYLNDCFSSDEKLSIEKNFLMKRKGTQQERAVDVIIPVYKNKTLTLNCIYSVLESQNLTDMNLIVINDKSPEDELVQKLEYLHDQNCIKLISNHKNKGFVYSVNKGMQVNNMNDVVLLNSDTRVFNNWLDRLCHHFNMPDIGTVTPLSNDATICSYPYFNQINSKNLEFEFEQIDRFSSQVNSQKNVETPTGVGFCMVIKRACLDEVGFFDLGAFGKGYGEENDFCQRAIISGWKNVIAADVFVWHYGGGSFGYEKNQRIAHAMAVMNEKYKAYSQDVERFIKLDPLLKYRKNIDLERLKRSVKKENILFFSHNRGGGSERFLVDDFIEAKELGYGVFMARPHMKSKVSFSNSLSEPLPNLTDLEITNESLMVSILSEYRINIVHIHSTVDFDQSIIDCLLKWKRRIKFFLRIYIHDYTFICPNINLVNYEDNYCGEPEEDACNSCIKKRSQFIGVKSISTWRKKSNLIITEADEVLVPDEDVHQRLSRYFPNDNFIVRPHEDINPARVNILNFLTKENGRIKVVVIGAISIIKGYDILLSAAIYSKKNKLPIDFVLMGYSMDDDKLIRNGVSVTGKYRENNSKSTLKSLNPSIVWLPSIWPETYSYTLSIVFKSGIPLMAFDIGAIASRVRAKNYEALLMPITMEKNARLICKSLMDFLAVKKGNDDG